MVGNNALMHSKGKMPPRKREKENEPKKMDHKPDHELFIQAYESKSLFSNYVLEDHFILI